MRLLFPYSYDRADLLMSAGCCTFVSAALIVVIPRLGILLLELLLGLFFIGCAVVARTRLRRQARAKDGSDKAKDARIGRLNRYDVFLILAVILIQTSAAGSLRRAGLSEGTVGILPLFLFAASILLKPRAVEFMEARRKNKQEGRGSINAVGLDSAGAAPGPSGEARAQAVVRAAGKNGDLE
jgi:hypothetical protein